jgi:hypothetical protein
MNYFKKHIPVITLWFVFNLTISVSCTQTQQLSRPNGAYQIEVPNYQLIESKEPESGNQAKALKPNSIRLLIYSKK